MRWTGTRGHGLSARRAPRSCAASRLYLARKIARKWFTADYSILVVGIRFRIRLDLTRTTAALRVRDKSLRAPALARARSAAGASRAEPRTHEPPRRSELTCRPVPPHRPEPMADAGPMANAGPMADAGLRQGSAAPPLTSGLPRGLCLIWGDGVKSTPRTHGVTPRVRAACTSSYRAASAVQGGH